MLYNWTKRNKPSVVWGPGMYVRCHDEHNYPKLNAHCGLCIFMGIWNFSQFVHVSCVRVCACGWAN